jgi:fanconi-associated nuclease 1
MDAFLIKRKPSDQANSQDVLPLKERPAHSEYERRKKKIKREKSDESDSEPDNYQIDSPSLRSRPHIQRDDMTDSQADDDTGDKSETDDDQAPRPTAIESSLPEIKPDKHAIEEYQHFKASQGDDNSSASFRLESRAWVRGKSSLYVDAFNLALDTVLAEESHLFDDKEKRVFEEWRSLSYETQFLYVEIAWLQTIYRPTCILTSLLDMFAYFSEKLLRGTVSLVWAIIMILLTPKLP